MSKSRERDIQQYNGKQPEDRGDKWETGCEGVESEREKGVGSESG